MLKYPDVPGFENVWYIRTRVQNKCLGNKIRSSWGMRCEKYMLHSCYQNICTLHIKKHTHKKQKKNKVNTTQLHTSMVYKICLIKKIYLSHLRLTNSTQNYGISHSGEWPYIFDAINLGVLLICDYIVL